MIALGEISGIDEARCVIGNSFEIKSYKPENAQAWEKAYADFKGILGK